MQVKYNINWSTPPEPGKVGALERMSYVMHVRTENFAFSVLSILLRSYCFFFSLFIAEASGVYLG